MFRRASGTTDNCRFAIGISRSSRNAKVSILQPRLGGSVAKSVCSRSLSAQSGRFATGDKHFPKSHTTHNIYRQTHQSITPKKTSMTAQPVPMTARKARCYRNSISCYHISSRPLCDKRQKNTGLATFALPLRLLCPPKLKRRRIAFKIGRY